MTSPERKISLDCRSNKMCPFTPICKRKYEHFLDLESSFFLLAYKVEAKQRELETLRRLRYGKQLYKIWKDDLLWNKCVGIILMRWITWLTAYDRKSLGNWAWNMRDLVIPRICWCFISTMSFCWGVPTYEVWRKIPIYL